MIYLEKIKGFIDNFDPTDIGNIIILAVVMCILTVCCIRAVYTTVIEEIFMDTQKKMKNDVWKCIYMLAVLVPTNFLLAAHVLYFLIEMGICIVGGVVCIVYYQKERNIEKYNLNELQMYYRDKQAEVILLIILCVMPAMILVCKSLNNTMSYFSCVVIISIIEVAIIGISIPGLLVKDAMNYFENEQEKMFIYKRMEDDTIICGDSENISKASKYIVISLDQLKSKEIHHLQHKSITKDEKNKLYKSYKKAKDKKQKTKKEKRKTLFSKGKSY